MFNLLAIKVFISHSIEMGPPQFSSNLLLYVRLKILEQIGCVQLAVLIAQEGLQAEMIKK